MAKEESSTRNLSRVHEPSHCHKLEDPSFGVVFQTMPRIKPAGQRAFRVVLRRINKCGCCAWECWSHWFYFTSTLGSRRHLKLPTIARNTLSATPRWWRLVARLWRNACQPCHARRSG